MSVAITTETVPELGNGAGVDRIDLTGGNGAGVDRIDLTTRREAMG